MKCLGIFRDEQCTKQNVLKSNVFCEPNLTVHLQSASKLVPWCRWKQNAHTQDMTPECSGVKPVNE